MVDRRYLPLADIWDDHAPGILTWLQAWYASQCDGEWEHGHGLKIDTLDNPGWCVEIDLGGTRWSTLSIPATEMHRSEHDWVSVHPAVGRFTAACGPLNLGEVVHQFRLLVDGPPDLAERDRQSSRTPPVPPSSPERRRRMRWRWPTSPSPTVPPDGPPSFRCPSCRAPLGPEDRCGICGTGLPR